MIYSFSIYAFALLIAVDVLPSSATSPAGLSLRVLIAVDTQLYRAAGDIRLCQIVLDMPHFADRS